MDQSNVVSLARYRATGRKDAEYLGDLYEWRLIGEAMSPPELAAAVGHLRGRLPAGRVVSFSGPARAVREEDDEECPQGLLGPQEL